jgi:hypothetical protein
MATKGKSKKTYNKPKVTQVKLEISEAVLQACKAYAGDASGKQTTKDCAHPGCVGFTHPS